MWVWVCSNIPLSQNTSLGRVLNCKLCINNNSNFWKINISVPCSVSGWTAFLVGSRFGTFPHSSSLSWFTSPELQIHTGGRNRNLCRAHRHGLTEAISNSVKWEGQSLSLVFILCLNDKFFQRETHLIRSHSFSFFFQTLWKGWVPLRLFLLLKTLADYLPCEKSSVHQIWLGLFVLFCWSLDMKFVALSSGDDQEIFSNPAKGLSQPHKGITACLLWRQLCAPSPAERHWTMSSDNLNNAI